MIMLRRLFRVLLILPLLLPVALMSASAYASEQRQLLLISIDGLRWDYLQQYKPPTLLEMKRSGGHVKQLYPVFPSTTFANHLSLATGLYPEHHGIVANRFYQPELKREYNKRDADSVTDGRFYAGVPIWALAEQQQLTSAVYFWPGSEAEIAGERPSYVVKYNSRHSHRKRVEKVIDWLSLPKSERPRLLQLYFSAVDSAGHKYGPDHRITKSALMDIDKHIGRLLDYINNSELNVDVVVVGDHGMRDSDSLPRIYLDEWLENDRSLRRDFKILGAGSLVQFYFRGKGNKAAALGRLKAALANANGFEFYQRNDIPDSLHFRSNPAVGDAIAVSASHYLTFSNAKRPPQGVHGYDANNDEQMRTLLLAVGPRFRAGAEVTSAKNVDLYPLMAQLLGLKVDHPIDGNKAALTPLLNEPDEN